MLDTMAAPLGQNYLSINGTNNSWSSTKGGHIILNTWQHSAGSAYMPPYMSLGGTQNTSNPYSSFGTGPFSMEFYHGEIENALTSVSDHILPFFQDDTFLLTFNPLAIKTHYVRFGINIQNNNYHLAGHNLDGSGNAFSNASSNTRYESGSSSTYSFPTSWEQIVMVRENTGTNGMKFYRNATLVGTTTNSKDYDANGTMSGFTRFFYRMKCKVGLIRIYTGTALTQSEIQTHYNIEKPRFGLP
tara:strand:- start:159 stop:890 length:732 start_codon:yes stop_codon:yes gene_type:complete